MSEHTLFHSRKFFVFNLVLVGIVAGFVLSLFAFSFSTRLPGGGTGQNPGKPGSPPFGGGALGVRARLRARRTSAA